MKRFYVVGNPVSHSLSPKLFTYIFNTLNIDAEYLTYMPTTSNELRSFLNNKMNKFSGLNVTLPFKVDSYHILDQHDKLASKIKSINWFQA